jgi:hypothetical protein
MALQRFSKLEEFEDRHPGLCCQVEAMFKAFIPLRAIAAAIQAQYSESIGAASLGSYRTECWDAWRAEV